MPRRASYCLEDSTMKTTPIAISDLRRLAYVLIDYLGPMTPEQLGSQMYVWREVAAACLEHPAFDRYPRPWGGPRLYTLRHKVINNGG